MFIREYKTKNKKNGNIYITHKLVEAYRVNTTVKQRIIMNLGTLSVPRSDWRKLAVILESRLSGQVCIFERDTKLNEIAAKAIEHHELIQDRNKAKTQRVQQSKIISIDIESLRTSKNRSLGPELVANSAWEQLQFEEILKDADINEKEIAVAKAVIIGRLINPSTELDALDWINNRSSILELLPVHIDMLSKDAVYEMTDKLFAHKEHIETSLRKKEENLLKKSDTIFLFDLTNAYFKRSGKKNSITRHDVSKKKEFHCPLVTLAVCVNSIGFPIYSEIYDSSQSEPETLEDILYRLERKNTTLSVMKPTLIIDRKIATKDNISLIKSRGYEYILIQQISWEEKYDEEFKNAKDTFEVIKSDRPNAYGELNNVYIKKIDLEETSRIICLNESRLQEYTSINVKKEEDFIEDIKKIENSINKGYLKVVEKVGERIEKLKQKYPSIAGYYDININLNEETKKVKEISWSKKSKKEGKDILSGCYVIETTLKEMSAKNIWNVYTTLKNVEYSFKTLKTDLGLIPIYHQKSERTKAHLFISVLAYHLLNSIEKRLKNNDDHRKWSTIMEQLSTHKRSTVIFTDEDNQIHHIRVSSMPESVHEEIYRLLNVEDITKRVYNLAGFRL